MKQKCPHRVKLSIAFEALGDLVGFSTRDVFDLERRHGEMSGHEEATPRGKAEIPRFLTRAAIHDSGTRWVLIPLLPRVLWLARQERYQYQSDGFAQQSVQMHVQQLDLPHALLSI